jgi:nucleoside-diphosphate-sugar epimerase
VSEADRVVTLTGGSGFVGQLLKRGLSEYGYRVRVFDRMRGPVVQVLRRRYLGTQRNRTALAAALLIHRAQRHLEPALTRRGLLRPTRDDIHDVRSALVDRFAGSQAVIHLAGVPHPRAPGVSERDFWHINYHAAANVFEAAREAGVPKFIFASSAQVYMINAPVRLDQLPIPESNYLPTPEEGQTTYGYLKAEFERFLADACPDGTTQGISLRLEFPGVLSRAPANLYVSTSVENLVAGFDRAIEAPASFAFDVFNLVDAEVSPSIVDIREFIRREWPDVPDNTRGNDCLISTEKARSVLGYRPRPGGTYYHPSVLW